MTQSEKNELIEELKEYYPIPNLFLGYDYDQSLAHLNELIAEINSK